MKAQIKEETKAGTLFFMQNIASVMAMHFPEDADRFAVNFEANVKEMAQIISIFKFPELGIIR